MPVSRFSACDEASVQHSRDLTLELLRQRIGERCRGAVADRPGVLVGLLGRAIQSSRSPIMHEREASRLGLSCAYILVDFDALGLADDALSAVLEAGAALGFAGFNVTHPFKQRIVPMLPSLAPEARAIGAVNTVVFSATGATGHNTDAYGFLQSFREGLAGTSLSRVVLIGAGGAGAAVAHALLELRVGRLEIFDSESGRAEALADRLDRSGRRVASIDDLAVSVAAADGIVNAPPVGMAKYPGLPLPAELLQRRHFVADIVYFPLETPLLRQARALGCRTLSGIGMAIGQAARAFELFTGMAADRTAMAGFFEAA